MKKILLLAFVLFTVVSLRTTALEHSSLTKAIQSTVVVQTDKGDYGAGFFVKPRLVLTNSHVVLTPGVQTITITLNNESECQGKLGYRDEGLDLALVSVDCAGEPLKPATTAQLGDTAYAIGHPQMIPFVVTRGIVSRYIDKWVFSDVTISVGSSGGPLVDDQGNVLGVITKLHQETRLALAIQTSSIRQFLIRAGVVW
jgi:S1-C subfamily serine protease